MNSLSLGNEVIEGLLGRYGFAPYLSLDRGAMHTCSGAGVFETDVGAFIPDPNRIAPVNALLFGRRPSAIIRLVVSVIVDTVKAGSFRAFSHVRQKVFEAMPSVTEDDVAGHIVRVILKALAYPTPGHISWRFSQAVFSERTSARSGFTQQKRLKGDFTLSSARTTRQHIAFGVSAILSAIRLRYHCPAPKHFARRYEMVPHHSSCNGHIPQPQGQLP